MGLDLVGHPFRAAMVEFTVSIVHYCLVFHDIEFPGPVSLPGNLGGGRANSPGTDRVPGRLVVAVSKGIPVTAMSAPDKSLEYLRLAKLRAPE